MNNLQVTKEGREFAVDTLKQKLTTLKIEGRPERASRRPGWVVPVALVVILVAAGLAGKTLFAGRATEVEAVRPVLVQAAEAAAGAPILTATGYVVARREAVVSAKIQGRLSELRVEEGDRVEQGEVIARLESADFEAQVRRAEAAVQSAQASIQRAQADLDEFRRQWRKAAALVREEVLQIDEQEAAESRVRVGEAVLAQAGAQLSVAHGELALARANLENTLIRAPFAGTVVKKMAEVGESVAPIPPGVNISTASGAIVALADLETLEVETDIAEANVARLRPEQPALASVEAFPEIRFRARLRQIIPTADRTKATVMVKVTLLDRDPRLKPEMSAQVNFLETPPPPQSEGARPVITVPAESVVERAGKSVVFKVANGRARAVTVQAGENRAGGVIITSGLTGDENLVRLPPPALTDGAAIRVR